MIIIENVSKIVAEKCISGLFNVCGGITAKSVIVSHNDTTFNYTVLIDQKLNRVKEERAINFCKGIEYAFK